MPRKNKTQPHYKLTYTVGCSGKRRFTTEKLAEEAAEMQMLQQPSLELRTYQCPDCHKWHLTRQASR